MRGCALQHHPLIMSPWAQVCSKFQSLQSPCPLTQCSPPCCISMLHIMRDARWLHIPYCKQGPDLPCCPQALAWCLMQLASCLLSQTRTPQMMNLSLRTMVAVTGKGPDQSDATGSGHSA